MAVARRFSRVIEDFKCENCGEIVHGNGYTDHCPNCLWSKHVDNNPGDRSAECKGMMRPMYTEPLRGGGFEIYYKCEKCGERKRVTAAENDNKKLLEELLVRR
ncbi:MAG: RNHCP domain-containing protein [Candidatus Marsarchaeota archaeon]|jgi:rubrerythrin|nr:RNHCP domain-containing protein [Candidatus Marsarchaeota archaeon]MCL5419021.1 RNHCP domain-containing protein [Candidatus Marsarchaeota archaeon]